MASLNKCQIIGHLGQDPELKATPSGQQVCTISLATNEEWIKDGQKQSRVDWHRVVIWGKQAEAVAKYLKKGRQAYVEGKLQTRSWEKDGQKHYTTEIIASTVLFLDGGSEHTPAPQQQGGSGGTQQHASDLQDSDIPF